METPELLNPGMAFSGNFDRNNTSAQRSQQLVNDISPNPSNNTIITSFDTVGRPGMNFLFPYLSRGDLKFSALSSDSLSERPIVVQYRDSGLEYIEGFSASSANPVYQCALWIPDRGILRYKHPVRSQELVKKIRESYLMSQERQSSR